MKATLLFTCCLLLTFTTFAQNRQQRRISMKNLGSDSLHIPFNESYYLIEDSCAQIIRQARFNAGQRNFYGRFKDVSVANPDLVVAEGSYTSDGQKEGEFTSYHLNGKPQASGSFKEDKLDGEWHLFYESGNPKLTFTASEDVITIVDAWDENGTKVVDKGTGKYQVNLSMIIWKGKLIDGKPTGTWTATAPNDRTNKIRATEKFKEGIFVRGTGPIGNYTDASRIMWFSRSEIPFLNAETMTISFASCNSKARKTIVGAQYKNGADSFSEEIKKVASACLNGVDLKPYEDELHIKGEISEDGRLVELKYTNAFNDRIATGLVRALARLPLLEPALADGKPIRQKFEISFKFHQGLYYFNYRFLPIRL